MTEPRMYIRGLLHIRGFALRSYNPKNRPGAS